MGMRKEEKVVELLSAAIRGKGVFKTDNNDFDWKEVIDEAREHSVKALAYSGAKKLNLLKDIPKDMLEPWKKESIFTGINEMKHIKNTANILRSFNEENIPVIVLKGLVVRELYPNPEFRTMGDADILVHEEDLDKVRILLTSLGYVEDSDHGDHGAHIVFIKGGVRRIEVHWTLINDDFFIGTKEFEKSIWDNAMELEVGGVKALSLGYEDLAVHLCVHMAVHIAAGGFGLRQLCDLVVLVEKRGDCINWDSFYKKVVELKAEKFIIAIFSCCNKLFSMEIPKAVAINCYKVDEAIVDNLIADIFNSGVFGKRSINVALGSSVAFNKGNSKNEKQSVLIRYIRFIFPKAENMSDKYNYAKKNKLLIPIAWIHHLYSGIFNKHYNLKDKTKFITATVGTAKKRDRLLRNLDLKEENDFNC